MLEFEPEIESSLRGRYPEAIKEVYDHAQMQEILKSRPGTKRRHVFDFFDGCRMIVSREKAEHGLEVLHFSMSVVGENATRPESAEEALMMAVQHANELMGKMFDKRVTALISEEGVIHLIYDEKEDKGSLVDGIVPPANPMWN